MGKYKGLMLIVLVLLVLIAGEVVISQMLAKKKSLGQIFQTKNQTNSQTGTGTSVSPTKSEKIPPIEMAKKALDCLDANRDERGAFGSGLDCNENNQCKVTAFSNHTGQYVLWGRTKYIEKTNDQKELEILREDIDLYSDEKKVNMIQPNFVSKMFLYEMWQSKIFSEADKGKIKTLAKRLDMPELAVRQSVYEYASSANYQRPDFTSLVAGKQGSSYMKIGLVDEWEYAQIISAASEYIIDYRWFNDQFSLKVAESLFSGLIQNYNSSKTSFLNLNLLGLTAIQFYQATEEKVFLDLAINIYNHPEIQDPCFSNGSCSGILTVPIVSGIFSDDLYLATKETKYLELKSKMINYLVKSDLGSAEGCYNNLFPKSDKYKDTTGNGLAVGLLSEEVANE